MRQTRPRWDVEAHRKRLSFLVAGPVCLKARKLGQLVDDSSKRPCPGPILPVIELKCLQTSELGYCCDEAETAHNKRICESMCTPNCNKLTTSKKPVARC